MFLEKRLIKSKGKTRKSQIKYYLSHSYREKGKIKKIRKYLGVNLSKRELDRRKEISKKAILEQINILNTAVFNFSLKQDQIKDLNKFDKKIKITHLNKEDWRDFKDEFVYNTNAIEGSTVALEEVRSILDKKKKSKNPEVIETLGVARAIDYIRKTKKEISLSLIKKLHFYCFNGSKSFAGKFRDVNVVIKDRDGNIIHQGIPKENIKDSLRDLVKWHNENKNKFKPLVLAAIIHNQFEYIHPFQDGNGRVGRILLNYILIRNNYPPINILLTNRKKYYSCLKKYSKDQNLKPTVKFLTGQYYRKLAKSKLKNTSEKR